MLSRHLHTRRPRSLLVAGSLTVALLAAACGGEPDRAPRMPAAPVTTTPSEAAPSPQGTQTPATESPSVQAPRELRFTAPALAGGTIRGRDYAGKDLVIWFWAPW